jgi:hypothetical protein
MITYTSQEVTLNSANRPIGVFSTGTDPVCYLAKIPTTDEFDSHVYKLAHNCIECATCCKRAVNLLPLVGQTPDRLGQNISVFLYHGANCDNETIELRNTSVSLFLNQDNKYYEYVDPVIVSADTFPPLMQDGIPHWTVKPDEVTTSENASLYESGIAKYVDMKNETKLTSLVKILLSDEILGKTIRSSLGHGISESLALLSNCLEKTHHKDSLYRQTTDWMIGIINFDIDRFYGRSWNLLKPIGRLRTVMFALATSNLTKDHNDHITCTFYDQAYEIIVKFLKNAENLDIMDQFVSTSISSVS